MQYHCVIFEFVAKGIVMSEPREIAVRLAEIYGQAIDPHRTYPTGVALSGRLRLAAMEGDVERVVTSVTEIAQPLLNSDEVLPEQAPCLALACFADELSKVSQDTGAANFLINQADRFVADPDIRVEDFFFASTLLGRAFNLTGDERFEAALSSFYDVVDTQQDNGLFWHCHQSPYFWGRGNAFAALGLAEALSYVRDATLKTRLSDLAASHLTALAGFQHNSGFWHQVVDDPDSYVEHSATTMIGYAIARGITGGWLPEEGWRTVAERAWQAAAGGVGANGEIAQVCVGTGPMASLSDYLERPASDGVDARGGGFTLWFAIVMMAL